MSLPLRLLFACCVLALAGTAAGAADRITVVGLFKDMAILNVDGERRSLKTGETSPEGITLVSATSERAVLEVDGKRKTYRLGTHISSQFSKPETGAVYRIWPDPGSGLYIANGTINGFSMKFIVDTGASLISMNSNQARRIGINYRLEGREALSETASGLSKIYVVELDRVRVGDIELHDVKAAVHEGDHPRRVLLGNSFLERVTLQRDGKMLELRGKP